jgi:hypothetical protein
MLLQATGRIFNLSVQGFIHQNRPRFPSQPIPCAAPSPLLRLKDESSAYFSCRFAALHTRYVVLPVLLVLFVLGSYRLITRELRKR